MAPVRDVPRPEMVTGHRLLGPNRLWSLRDMPEFQAGKLISGFNMLASTTQLLTLHAALGKPLGMTRANVEALRQDADAVAEECLKMGLLVCAAAATDLSASIRRLIEEAQDPDQGIPLRGEVRVFIENYLNEVLNSLRREAQARKFFVVAAEHQRFYAPSGTLFGLEVDIQFENIRFDLTEAGKCIALERSTAAVYHLVRCLEAGIREIARSLAKLRTRRPGMVAIGVKFSRALRPSWIGAGPTRQTGCQVTGRPICHSMDRWPRSKHLSQLHDALRGKVHRGRSALRL